MSSLKQINGSLKGFGAFTRVITKGEKYEEKPIKAFVYLSSSKETLVRIGYTVTKRIKKAVKRNKLKRLMREAFRANKKDLIGHISAGVLVEIVFMYNDDREIVPNKVRFSSINQAISTICTTIRCNTGK
jgi:ribonuclease P protein component